jgi:hypothetical protein
LIAWFFISAEKKARRTILEWSISPILTDLILGEKNKMLGRQFFRGLTLLLFISTEIFKTKFRELAA